MSKRAHNTGMSPFAAGLLTLVLIAVGVYFGFTKAIPFQHHFTIKAVFPSANDIRPSSPVRIAGVNVGKVVSISHVHPGEQAAVVTMRIDDQGLPIHKDATMTIRPRIFLEGNFFVDLHPGSPSAPDLGDGDTVPINQTAAPVQLDQILTSLQSDTRQDLRIALRGLSQGLSGKGGQGYNRSIPYWKPAFRDGAIVSDALLGETQHDLSGYVANAGATAAALDRNAGQLQSLITDFNTTAAAFAREDGKLSQAVAELPRTLHAGIPALAALNRAFPPLRRFIVDARPATKSSVPALNASIPFVAQARGLVSQPELRGLTHDLRPTVPALAQLTKSTVPLYEQVRAASSCQNTVILPWTHDKIQDPAFPAEGDVADESTKPLVGLAGESRSGDANGQWFRVLLGGGNFSYPLGTQGFFETTFPLAGVNPPPPDQGPQHISPLRPDVPCETQQPPDLRTIALPPPAGHQNQIPAAARAQQTQAVQEAVTWLQKQLKIEGWKGYSVSDTAASVAQVAHLGGTK
jgi:phospholipid/cholesterol/gamma-HCH transport system substrate-binding protein